MALTPAERAQVADALYGYDEVDQSEVEAAWASVSVARFEASKSGKAKTFTRAEADAYRDTPIAARST